MLPKPPSGKPYPTNVGTEIGEQSSVYKVAKAMGNAKKRKVKKKK